MSAAMAEFNHTILTIMLLTSSILTLFLGAYVYVKSQARPVTFWFLVSFSLMLVWNSGYLFRQFSPSVTISWVLIIIEMVSVIFIGPVCYLFSRAYRGVSNKVSFTVYLFLIAASLQVLAVISDPIHHYFFLEFSYDKITAGPLYYGVIVFLIICFIFAAYHFAKSFRQPSIYWRQQLWYLGNAVLVPALACIVETSGIMEMEMQLTLMVMPFSLILVSIAVMKYQFLDILPYSLTEVVESIDDGFVVISLTGNLEDYNKVFFDRFVNIDKCRTVEELLLLLREIVDNRVALNNIRYSINVKNDNYVSGELIVKSHEGLTNIQYTTKAINDVYGVKIATIITFHDITEIQHLYSTLEAKKAELILARERLEQHIETVQMLTVETERNKLMVEVHDTLGHTMAEVLALLEKCDVALNEAHFEKDKAEMIIDEASDRARKSLTEIRAAVTRFKKMGVE